MSNNKEWAKYWWNWSKENINYALTTSGRGSAPDSTGIIVEFINKVIKERGVQSINDAPCGEFGIWMHRTNLDGILYRGFDINDEVIKINRKRFPGLSFQELDISSEVLPAADLILCRDCLFHLTNDAVARTLENFKKSGSKYLLATNHSNVQKNVELPQLAKLNRHYGYRDVNIMAEPFNWPKPIEFINEPKWNRQFCLWELQ